MSAMEAPAEIARRNMREYIRGPNRSLAVEAVFDVLSEPDRDMIAAGVLALDYTRSRAVVVEAVWRAMLEVARR